MFFLSCFCYAFVRLFICTLWSPAGKGLTSWLSFVVSNCEFVLFPFVSWVRCSTWLNLFLVFAPFLTMARCCWPILCLSQGMLHIVTHLYTCHNVCSNVSIVTHLIPVIMYVMKFLTYVMAVIRYVAWSNTSYSSYKVWSEAAGIPYVCHKVC